MRPRAPSTLPNSYRMVRSVGWVTTNLSAWVYRTRNPASNATDCDTMLAIAPAASGQRPSAGSRKLQLSEYTPSDPWTMPITAAGLQGLTLVAKSGFLHMLDPEAQSQMMYRGSKGLLVAISTASWGDAGA